MCFNSSGGVLLTSMTVTHSLSLVVFTYGLLFGVGARAGYMSPIAAAMRVFTKFPLELFVPSSFQRLFLYIYE